MAETVDYQSWFLAPIGFGNVYTQRNVHEAPELSQQFDARAQEIYAGFDPKTVFFPPAQRENYPDIPPEELEAVACALNDHGRRSLELGRTALGMRNLVWLGLASKADAVIIRNGEATNKQLEKIYDEHGWFMRSPATDVGVVGPRNESPVNITLAMGVADCLAVPLVDIRTHAFGFAHAGRPGTGLRTVENTAYLLKTEFGSKEQDLVAYLGEGVCMECYLVDEKTYQGFVHDFGGKAEIDKVLSQYPDALREVDAPEGKQVAIDLYAFNKFLLDSQNVGEIIVRANCTARSSEQCASLETDGVPAEKDQKFFSHERAKGKTVGWRTENGQMIDLNTFHLTTPRNLAEITRF